MDTNVPLIARMTTADAAKNFPGKSSKTASQPAITGASAGLVQLRPTWDFRLHFNRWMGIRRPCMRIREMQ